MTDRGSRQTSLAYALLLALGVHGLLLWLPMPPRPAPRSLPQAPVQVRAILVPRPEPSPVTAAPAMEPAPPAPAPEPTPPEPAPQPAVAPVPAVPVEPPSPPIRATKVAPAPRVIATPKPVAAPAPAVAKAKPKPASQSADAPPPAKPTVAPPRGGGGRTGAGQLLASGEDVARSLAAADQPSPHGSKGSRSKELGAAPRDYAQAAYLEAWRRKVEQIGNLNFPEQAKRDRLSGSLVLRVAVRSDGSVESIRVVRSSGSKILDDAATAIVRLAAPFAPFPAGIRAEADVLEITRTWQFRSDHRLLAQ